MSELEGQGDYGSGAAPRRSAAARNSPRIEVETITTAAPEADFETDRQFVDNLVAANRFKTFLVGRGVEVPDQVLKGLGGLMTDFKVEVEAFNEAADEAARSRKRLWLRG